MRRVLLCLLVVAGCTKAGPEATNEPPTPVVKEPGVAPAPPPKTAPEATARIELTAVTLADDCGGTPPYGAPKASVAPAETRQKGARSQERADRSRARVRCEQTSMQLAVQARDAATIRIKSVELFDEAGTSVGTLIATKPTMWSATSSTYEAWDEKVAAGATINVSYVLSQPSWATVSDRWNKTFTLKAVVSVGGVDQTAQKDVTLSAPTSLPPNVRT